MNHVGKLRRAARAMRDQIPLANDDVGYVYILACPSTGLMKIGRAADVVDRVCAIARMSGARLELVSIMSDPGNLEAHLHRRFAKYRKHGEWFALPRWELAELVQAAGSAVIT